MGNEKIGIEKLLKTIEAVQILAVAGKDIAKDGLGMEDLPKALELIKQYEMFISIVNEIDDAVLEVKDIDSAEAVELVVAMIAAFKAIKA